MCSTAASIYYTPRAPNADSPARGPLRLVYFGRLIEDKGVHTALEALGLLGQQAGTTRVELTVLGSGPPEYEAHLRAMTVALGIEKQVRDLSGQGPTRRGAGLAWSIRRVPLHIHLARAPWPGH